MALLLSTWHGTAGDMALPLATWHGIAAVDMAWHCWRHGIVAGDMALLLATWHCWRHGIAASDMALLATWLAKKLCAPVCYEAMATKPVTVIARYSESRLGSDKKVQVAVRKKNSPSVL
jgi:hypothetical protein